MGSLSEFQPRICFAEQVNVERPKSAGDAE
jgi:hypothetical protein